ncbi:YjbF family lipoprotein [Pseudidiomarina marina]|uniref:YjbF family lipoprotein n=1 Tax=Pseudidiomarina marina TaxID=502366 RepID=UPI0038513CBF
MKAKQTFYIQVIILALISTLISGCSARLQNYQEIVTELFSTPEDVTLSQQEIEEFPYAGSYIQVDKRPRAFMALAFDDNGVLKWRTGGEEIIHTKHGRITATNNMSGAIAHTSNLKNDPLGCFRVAIIDDNDLETCSTTWQREIWVTTATPEKIEDQAYTYTSEFKVGATEQVSLANGSEHQVIKIEERVSTGTSDHHITNTFYISTDNGRIVKSHQLIAPQSNSESTFATIEEVKPYTLEKVKNNG